LILSIIERYRTRVISPAGDLDEIVGWICGDSERSILHYCYVKQAFRSYGFCRQLLADMKFDHNKNVFYSHKTKAGRKLTSPEWKYDPFLAWGA